MHSGKYWQFLAHYFFFAIWRTFGWKLKFFSFKTSEKIILEPKHILDPQIIFDASKFLRYKLSNFLTLLRATYAWPGLNWPSKLATILSTVKPCTLCIVHANESFKGNCVLDDEGFLLDWFGEKLTVILLIGVESGYFKILLLYFVSDLKKKGFLC